MGIFFSWADLAHIEGGFSLLGWLLGVQRLGMGIFFSWADLAHSAYPALFNSWIRQQIVPKMGN